MVFLGCCRGYGGAWVDGGGGVGVVRAYGAYRGDVVGGCAVGGVVR